MTERTVSRRRVLLLVVGLVVAVGSGLGVAWNSRTPIMSYQEDMIVVIVPITAPGSTTGTERRRAEEASSEVVDWFERYGVSLSLELQGVRSSTAGERLFTTEEAVNACSDDAWKRVLPLFEPLDIRVSASTEVVFVVLGGAIRAANGPRQTQYGVTCRLGDDECSEAVEVTVPGLEGPVHVDALIAVDWRPEHATPLVPVLAHELGHAMGLAHEDAPELRCQLPATGTDSGNLMHSAAHIGPESRLAMLSLTPTQAQWISASTDPRRGEQN